MDRDGPPDWERYRCEHTGRLHLDDVFLGGLLAMTAVGSLLQLAFFLGGDGSLSLVILLAATLAIVAGVPVGRWALRRNNSVRVTAFGVEPEARNAEPVPASAINGVVPRRWRIEVPNGNGLPLETCHQVLQLRDGRHVRLPGLHRPERIGRRPPRILMQSSVDPRWRPLVGDDGRPVYWSAGNDYELAALLDRRFKRILRPDGTDPFAAAAAVRHRELEGPVSPAQPPSGAGQNGWLNDWFASHTAVNVCVPVLRPEPAPPALGHDEYPAWEDLGTPASYWSEASTRVARLPGQRHELRFTARGLLVRNGWQRRRVPYEQVVGFRYRLNDDLSWEACLLLDDGFLLRVDALLHARYKQNRLLWKVGDPDNQSTGAMRWHAEDNRLVLTRLNDQLQASAPQLAPSRRLEALDGLR